MFADSINDFLTLVDSMAQIIFIFVDICQMNHIVPMHV